jgi:hypothetical protein
LVKLPIMWTQGSAVKTQYCLPTGADSLIEGLYSTLKPSRIRNHAILHAQGDGLEVIFLSHMAARFAGLYSRRKTGYVLPSARVLSALTTSAEAIESAHGLLLRDTCG